MGDVIKMLRVFPGFGSAMHTHVRAATVLPLLWPIQTTLPVSSAEILMRHPDCSRRDKDGRRERREEKLKHNFMSIQISLETIITEYSSHTLQFLSSSPYSCKQEKGRS